MYYNIVKDKMEVWASVSPCVENNAIDTEELIEELLCNVYTSKFKSVVHREILAGGKIGNELVNKEGKIQKRLIKYMYKEHGIALNTNYVSVICNRRLHKLVAVGSIKITKDLTWESGDYGDKGSCFWTCHSLARIALKHHPNMYACLFRNLQGKGMGRIWFQVTPKGIFTFNVYPNKKYKDLFCEHLRRYLCLDMVNNIGVVNKGTSSGWMFINSESSNHIHNADVESVSIHDLDMEACEPQRYSEYGGKCSMCNKVVWTDTRHDTGTSSEMPKYVDTYYRNVKLQILCYKCYVPNRVECACGNVGIIDSAIWRNHSREIYVCSKCIDYPAIIRAGTAYKADMFVQLPDECRLSINVNYVMKGFDNKLRSIGGSWYMLKDTLIHANINTVRSKLVQWANSFDAVPEDFLKDIEGEVTTYIVEEPKLLKYADKIRSKQCCASI